MLLGLLFPLEEASLGWGIIHRTGKSDHAEEKGDTCMRTEHRPPGTRGYNALRLQGCVATVVDRLADFAWEDDDTRS